MPAPAGTTAQKSLWGFLIFVIIVHILDVMTRYGTSPFQIGPVPGSPTMWTVFFFAYGVLWLVASANEAFAQMGQKKLIVAGLIAYVWGPFWSILPVYFPALKYIAALFMLIAPFWLIIAFYATSSFPKTSLIYAIIWFALITFALFPNIQEFAQEKGYPLPNALSPGMVLSYSWEKMKEGTNRFVNYFVQTGEKVSEEIAMARGDYYTGQVDTAAKKRLGVYLENFKPSETVFYENTPVIAYATVSAETLDRELEIFVVCNADKEEIPANSIRPKDTFQIMTSDQFDIDCIWNPGILKTGMHNLKLSTEFEFTTRAYLKTYMMDRDRLREYKKQGTDPLEGIPDKNPVAVYTSGPVRVGMSIGQQPIALGSTGEALPNLGVTISNAWQGKVVQITGIYFIVPEGIRIPSIEGVDSTEVSCEALPEEERQACDDTLVNVYALSTAELSLPYYKNLTAKTFRIPLEIINAQEMLGKAPLGVQNFKVSVQYLYVLERTTSANVKEVEPAV